MSSIITVWERRRSLEIKTLEQQVPLKGVKEKPKRAMLAYYDDVLGNIENK